MNYNPNFLDYKEIFSENEKQYLDNLSKKVPENFLKSFRNMEEFGTDFVYTSSQLEGNNYNKYETETLIKIGQTASGKKFTDAVMILNLRDSFEYMIANFDKDVNKDLLKDLHYHISKNLVSHGLSGVVRDHSVKIGGTNYTPLSNPQKLEDELNYLIKVSEKYSTPFEKAIYLHNNLCYLQYFVDCNKRTARNIMAFILMKEKIFPCLFSLSNGISYTKSIVDYYETGNYKSFKDYFFISYQTTIDKYGENILTDNNEINLDNERLEKINKDIENSILLKNNLKNIDYSNK